LVNSVARIKANPGCVQIPHSTVEDGPTSGEGIAHDGNRPGLLAREDRLERLVVVTEERGDIDVRSPRPLSTALSFIIPSSFASSRLIIPGRIDLVRRA